MNLITGFNQLERNSFCYGVIALTEEREITQATNLQASLNASITMSSRISQK